MSTKRRIKETFQVRLSNGQGKRTDSTAAVLAKVMAEMGFELGLIATASGLPRGTVKDIVQGNGPWRQMPRSEWS